MYEYTELCYEGNMVSQTLVREKNPFVIRSQRADMLGISGHKIAELDRASPVTIYGEQGPYTVVHCQGRNGYVLTDCLGTISDLDEKSSLLEPVAGEESARSRNSYLARLRLGVLSAAVLGSALPLALGLI